jgi:serine-type D-Ala-D-Ala carboxypeptidase/endopeptidase
MKSISWGVLALMAAAAPHTVLAQSPPAGPPTLAGDWSGMLPNLPPKQIIIHVRRSDQGMKLTMDVPALGLQGIPIDDFGREGAKLHFAMPAAHVVFDGELQPGGREIRGSFTDHDVTQPLILEYSASDAPPPPLKVASARQGWSLPSADDIRQMLKSEITARQAVGIVVGVVGPNGRMVVSEGTADLATGAPIGAETPLYVESTAKSLTGLLLADMAQHGEVKLDDPVDLYLPAGEHMPERNGRKITLTDLATHTSGLPRGENVAFETLDHYPSEHMRRYLASVQLTRDPGAAYEYSDVGTALLGDVLARRAGISFEQLVRSRIIEPLGLSHTLTHASPALVAQMPVEYDSGLQPRGRGGLKYDDTWIPSFGLYSTVDDMLTLLETQLGYRSNPLAAASAQARDVRRAIAPGTEESLAWDVRQLGSQGAEVFGGGGSSRSMTVYLAFRPDARTGVVIYTNARTKLDPVDIGLYVLTGRPAPEPGAPMPAGAQVAIRVPAATLAGYVGRYRLTPQMIVNITAQGERLFGAINDKPPTELFASSPTHFFARAANAQVDFQPGPDGRAIGLVLTLNGAAMSAARLAD